MRFCTRLSVCINVAIGKTTSTKPASWSGVAKVSNVRNTEAYVVTPSADVLCHCSSPSGTQPISDGAFAQTTFHRGWWQDIELGLMCRSRFMSVGSSADD